MQWENLYICKVVSNLDIHAHIPSMQREFPSHICELCISTIRYFLLPLFL
jgi:hypothetical protein